MHAVNVDNARMTPWIVASINGLRLDASWLMAFQEPGQDKGEPPVVIVLPSPGSMASDVGWVTRSSG